MTTTLSAKARHIIAETLPLIEQHRAPLEEGFQQYLTRQASLDAPGGRTNDAASAILEMLLHGAQELGGDGSATEILEMDRQRMPAVDGEHFVSFGDGLKPIFKDVLGATATSPLLAAWTDTYWAIVQALPSDDLRRVA